MSGVETDQAIERAKDWLISKANLFAVFLVLDAVTTDQNRDIVVDFYYGAFTRPGFYRVVVDHTTGKVRSFKRSEAKD